MMLALALCWLLPIALGALVWFKKRRRRLAYDPAAKKQRDDFVAMLHAEGRSILQGGFSFKPESLDVEMIARSFPTMRWLGEGPRPLYRPRWEWFREKVLRLKPRWAPFGWPLNWSMEGPAALSVHTMGVEEELKAGQPVGVRGGMLVGTGFDKEPMLRDQRTNLFVLDDPIVWPSKPAKEWLVLGGPKAVPPPPPLLQRDPATMSPAELREYVAAKYGFTRLVMRAPEDRPRLVCTCPLSRPAALPHLEGCPRRSPT